MLILSIMRLPQGPCQAQGFFKSLGNRKRMRLWLILLALFWVAWPAWADRKASVIYTWQTVSDKDSIDSMSRTLGTSPVANPDKAAVLNAFRSSDVVYINTHTYSGQDHPNAHGALVVGSGFKSDPGNNLIRPEEVRAARGGNPPPQLVVLGGCSAGLYGWPQALGGTVIAFRRDIHGAGCDIVFKYFFDYWTSGNLTIQEALDRAFAAAENDPSVRRVSGGILSNIYDLRGLRGSLEVHGNGGLRYSDVTKPPPPPPPALTSLDMSGVIVSEDGGKYETTVQFLCAGLPAGTPVSLSYQAVITGPAGYRKSLSAPFSVPTCGYTATAFGFTLPDDAADGTYTVTVTLSSGGLTSLPGTRSFNRSTPALSTGFKGDQEVEEGKSAMVVGTITGGRPPYRWQWSGPSGGNTGSGSSFTMNGAGSVPQMVFSVQVWDSGRNAGSPKTDKIVVKVNKPADPELTATISGPGETAVRRNETYTLNLQGGVPPFQADWYTGSGSFPGNPNSTLYFGQPGTATLQAKVWDQGKHKKSPLIVTTSVLVHDKLTGVILGPDEVAPDQQIDLNHDISGGKPNIRWKWTTSSGHELTSRTLSGKVRGNPGEVKVVTLDAEDSLNPPQKLHLEKRITIKAPSTRVTITGMEVVPGSFNPGARVRVKAYVTIHGFYGPNALCDTNFWLESASGSGRGYTVKGDVTVPQDTPYEVFGDFNTDPKGQGGPITAQVRLQVGDVVASQSCTAQMKRPGGLEDITVDSRTVQLRIWDHGSEDGDIVSIFLNNTKLGQGKITKRGGGFTLNLNPGPNTLTVLAHNEGTSSPNTASVSITNVIRGPAQQEYNLTTGAKGFFLITAP